MIEYLPQIVNQDGKVLTTPARISKVTGRIQVSKKQFDDYTVPMRFAILCHEFSHFYVNENMDDESEADINGLLIYLGLGYPRIEACEAFLEVFEHYPSQENKMRYDKIKNFIDNFEKDNIKNSPTFFCLIMYQALCQDKFLCLLKQPSFLSCPTGNTKLFMPSSQCCANLLP